MKTNLNSRWAIRSSAELGVGGEVLSRPGLDATGWLPVSLPATVLGALVDAGVYGDVFAGDRILDLPGQGPAAQNFANYEMPEDSPFRVAWWFRTEFRLQDTGGHLRLQLDGINYRANIWLNGRLIADSTQMVGAYREYLLDINDIAEQHNVLAIEIFPPGPNDVAISWVDWNPSPPDKNMGIWRDVWVLSTGPVAIRDSHVVTDFAGARLTLATDLVNLSDRPQTATLHAHTEGRHLSQTIDLAPHEQRRVEQHLALDGFKLWWPRNMGEPVLYSLRHEVVVEGQTSDSSTIEYGVREVRSELNDDGHTQFFVNNQPILIRGAGWATDLFLRRHPGRDLAQLDYVKAMNLNTVRFEGLLERSSFLEQCDRDGLLVIAGWCCCDCWERWASWNEETHHVATESLRSQIRRTRRHPSMIAWWYGSDFPPPGPVEREYLAVLESEHWPNAHHSSAAAKPTELTGPTGMKMEGPYDYVPPNYWLEDTERGGAFGFATEVCPGPAVPPIESLRAMLGEDHLWPIDEVWNLHSGGQEFHNIEHFMTALVERYGAIDSVEEFAALSQIATYEAQRAMFEAWAKNRPRATGVIQWMLNNAWPSLIWHLYDHTLRPAGGFFGTQKACEPLHVLYAPDDRCVYVANDQRRAFRGLRVEARALSADSEEIFSASAEVDIAELQTVRALQLPAFDTFHFLDLRLHSHAGEHSRNLYWLSAEPDLLAHDKGSWIHTPIERYANLHPVRTLPQSSVQISAVTSGGEGRVVVRNTSDALAFFLQLRLVDEGDQDVLPVLWSDNYVSLLPSESCVVKVQCPGVALDRRHSLHLSGPNIPDRRLSLSPSVAKAG